MRSLLAPSRGSQSSSMQRVRAREGEIRVVEKADLAGIGLVASPSYPNSRVETRAAGTLSRQHPLEPLPCMRVLREGVRVRRDVEKG